MIIIFASIGILLALIFIIFTVAVLVQKYYSKDVNDLDGIDKNAVFALKKPS